MNAVVLLLGIIALLGAAGMIIAGIGMWAAYSLILAGGALLLGAIFTRSEDRQ